MLSVPLTLSPSKTKAWSSEPSSRSGRQPGRAQPTRISPAVTTSSSKYHFPPFTLYVFSARKIRKHSADRSATSARAAAQSTVWEHIKRNLETNNTEFRKIFKRIWEKIKQNLETINTEFRKILNGIWENKTYFRK